MAISAPTISGIIKRIVFLLPLLLPVIGRSQFPYPSLKLTHFSIANGLSDDGVQCLLQDKQGFLWIGTMDGLNRFDGLNFVVYRKQWNDTASLPDNVIKALAEDSDSRIWIAT